LGYFIVNSVYFFEEKNSWNYFQQIWNIFWAIVNQWEALDKSRRETQNLDLVLTHLDKNRKDTIVVDSIIRRLIIRRLIIRRLIIRRLIIRQFDHATLELHIESFDVWIIRLLDPDSVADNSVIVIIGSIGLSNNWIIPILNHSTFDYTS
jgi:hypothetical protein